MTRVIGERYELGRKLGEGGMGTVYSGVDTKTGETVAIKSIKADLIAADPSMLERFEREGDMLRRMNHPNIVKMLGAVEDGGEHFLVMEYVGGGTLQNLLDESPQMPIQRVIEIALDLSDALTRAHRLKIIHRDIKPPNVLIAEDGTPRLTDFGVAQMGDRTRMTSAGAVVGTYAYLSPEALSGDELDARSDIWAFGVLLFEMLTGTHPFKSDSTAALLTAILMNEAPDVREYRPDAPAPLANLVARMLIKERDARISSVRQVGAYLEAINANDSSAILNIEQELASGYIPTPTPGNPLPLTTLGQQQPDTPTTVTPLPERLSTSTPATPARRLPFVPLLGILLLVIVVGAVLVSRSPGGVIAPTVPPVAPGEYMVLLAQITAREGAAIRDVTTPIYDDLREVIEIGVAFSNVRIRQYASPITSDEEARRVAEATGATIIIWGDYDQDDVELRVQVGVLTAFPNVMLERDELERTLNIRVRLTDLQEQSIALFPLASLGILHSVNDDSYTVLVTEAILDALNVNIPEIVSNSTSTHAIYATIYFFSDEVRALEEINTALERDSSNWYLYVLRGSLNFRLDNNDAARIDLSSALRLQPSAIAYGVRGNVELAAGDINSGIADWERAVELRPDDWFAWNFLGALRFLAGDYRGSREAYDRALALDPEANFPYGPSAVIALMDGRISDASRLMRTSLTEFPNPDFANRTAQAFFGESRSPAAVWGPSLSAYGLMTLGQYETALEEIQRAIDLGWEIAPFFFLKGYIECNLNDYEAAEASYSRAIELDPDFILLYGLRGQVRLELGQVIQAGQDTLYAQANSPSREFEALLQAGIDGEVDCHNFFEYELSIETAEP